MGIKEPSLTHPEYWGEEKDSDEECFWMSDCYQEGRRTCEGCRKAERSRRVPKREAGL